jgi:hypothetical protein
MIKTYFKKDTIYILLLLNGNITGIIKVFKRTNKQGVLDLFIRIPYRSRWLNKELYFNLKSKFIDICSKVGYSIVITRLNNFKSLRLLNHFGFMKYNEKYYYLGIC